MALSFGSVIFIYYLYTINLKQNKMEEKQTAVDYLFEMWLQDKTITKEAYEKAKAIEKKQLDKAYDDAGDLLYRIMNEG